jgi:SPP1 gp7 family putative phage head morphogenesis protein
MPINALHEYDFTPQTDREAAERLRRKAALKRDEFDQLSARQRRHAFTMAKVNNARLLQQIKNKLRAAIDKGVPYADFRRQVEDLFDRKGLPRPALHRIQLVFRMQAQQAYSDGRREVLDSKEVSNAFGYRMYKTVGNGTPGVRNVRPDHAVLHNKIFKWNDPFWDRFTPPWDYNCRCTFIALTEGQVKARRGIVWTWKGGAVTPLTDKRPKPIKVKPTKGFSSRRNEKLDLSGLDEDLRQALEASLGN